MHDWQHEAIGTHWRVLSDDRPLDGVITDAIVSWLCTFEARFSRFKPDSEVNVFRNAQAGSYTISPEFARMLELADTVRTLTDGHFDPAAGALLERAGYDAAYRFTPDEVDDFTLPHWSIESSVLTVDGPTAFDLGGIGKGYAIDQVVALLQERDYHHVLVEAGGDIFATTKANGQPWRSVIEYPGKPALAAGALDISNAALAVSDTFKRRWGSWHHLVDPQQKRPVAHLIGAAALAPSALAADAMTSALAFAVPENHSKAASHFKAQFLVFHPEGTVRKSAGWPGVLYT